MQRLTCSFLILGLGLLICSPNAQAQEACFADDIQAAIDSAAADGDCVADGAYLSADSVLAVIEDKCFPDGDPVARCKPCLARMAAKFIPGLNALRKANLLPSDIVDAVRAGVRELKANCESNDQNGGSGDGNQGGGGSEEHHGTPGPTPSPTPGEGPNVDQLKVAVSSCHSDHECGACVYQALSGMISQENVQKVLAQVSQAVCSPH